MGPVLTRPRAALLQTGNQRTSDAVISRQVHEGLALSVVIGGNLPIKFASDSWVRVIDLLILEDVSVT